MTKNSTAAAQIVPFRQAKLLLVDHGGEPFVPMKPVVEGMGMAWQPQHRKLMGSRFSTYITEMVIQVRGDSQGRPYTCLPLRKLPGWLMSIHPNKVKPELRDGIIAYQNECDDVLWAYWNDGMVVRNDDRTVETVLNSTIGTNGFNMLAAVIKGKVAVLPKETRRRATMKIWSQAHTAFGVRSAQDIPADQLDAARNFVAAYALEGEWLPKQKDGEFVLDYYQAQEVCHLVHNAIWCVYHWDSRIAAGVKAMNYPLWVGAFEHFREAGRSARRVGSLMPEMIEYFRERLGGRLPEQHADMGVAA